MLKFKQIYKDYYLGIFFLGIVAIAIQELPYIIMPFVKLDSNPIMNMSESCGILNVFEKLFGILSMVLLVFVVRCDDKWFSVKTAKEKIFFFLALFLLSVNFIGWILYFFGFQSVPLIIICLFAVVPLYYTAIALWRKNYPLVITGVIFCLIHTTHGLLNFLL